MLMSSASAGVYKYLPDTHSLALVKEGDHRALLAGTPEFAQDFVMNAPYTILLVADMAELPDGERTKAMALVDAGIACENINLACTSLGLATVPRATMDSEAISKLLGLNARQLPVINNPVGYAVGITHQGMPRGMPCCILRMSVSIRRTTRRQTGGGAALRETDMP